MEAEELRKIGGEAGVGQPLLTCSCFAIVVSGVFEDLIVVCRGGSAAKEVAGVGPQIRNSDAVRGHHERM